MEKSILKSSYSLVFDSGCLSHDMQLDDEEVKFMAKLTLMLLSLCHLFLFVWNSLIIPSWVEHMECPSRMW